MRRLTDGDTASEVLAEFLGLVDDFDFDVKAVYVDREFYDGKCLTLMQALQQTLWNRSNVPSLGVVADFDDSKRFDETAAVRSDQPVNAERLAVSALGVRGDAAPRRASPLVVAVRGIHSHGHSCSVERSFSEARSSSEQAT